MKIPFIVQEDEKSKFNVVNKLPNELINPLHSALLFVLFHYQYFVVFNVSELTFSKAKITYP